MRRPRQTVTSSAPPGLAQSKCFKDPATGWTRRILPGEYYVTGEDESLSTVLGSCISACIRDPVAAVGGMNHFMLPDEGGGGGDRWLDPTLGMATRYGSYAMESLINGLMKRGARRERLEIKLFGGGRILSGMTDVGLRNIEFAHNYLRLDGLRCVAEDLGDVFPRKVAYSPLSGKARVMRLPAVASSAISAREKVYLSRIGDEEGHSGDVELFG
jgi:chemotaxis protein CheD